MYKHIKGTRLSSRKLNQIIIEFTFNTPARVCAEKLGIHRNTVNLWYQRMRKAVAQMPDPEPFSGEIEIDESYFGKKKTGKGRPGTVQGQGLAQMLSLLKQDSSQKFAKFFSFKSVVPFLCHFDVFRIGFIRQSFERSERVFGIGPEALN